VLDGFKPVIAGTTTMQVRKYLAQRVGALANYAKALHHVIDFNDRLGNISG
jgi:hypothetical protein